MVHEGFTKERYMYPRQPVPKSNWAAQVVPACSLGGCSVNNRSCEQRL